MPRKKIELPQREKLQSLLAYDANNGGFVYRKKRRGRGKIRPGDSAGVLQPNGHYTIMIDKKRYYIHRLVWFWFNGDNPELIEHIDGNKANNRIENLTTTTMVDYRRKRRVIRDAEIERDSHEWVS